MLQVSNGREAGAVVNLNIHVLSKEELALAHSRSKAITVTNKDFQPGSLFFRTTSLKSHDWKEVIHVIQEKLQTCLTTLGCSKEYFKVLPSWTASGSAAEDSVPVFGCGAQDAIRVCRHANHWTNGVRTKFSLSIDGKGLSNRHSGIHS